MLGWNVTKEPTLDELLRDDVMAPVMRSAGLSAAQLRALLAELARRLPAERFRQPVDCCSAARAFRPSAV